MFEIFQAPKIPNTGIMFDFKSESNIDPTNIDPIFTLIQNNEII